MSLKFKFNIAKSSANFGNDAFLFFLTVSNEGNGEAYEMSRIIPRYGGDQFRESDTGRNPRRIQNGARL